MLITQRPIHINNENHKSYVKSCPGCEMNKSFISYVLEGKMCEELRNIYLNGPWNEDGSFSFKSGRVKVIKDIGYMGEPPDYMFVGCEGEIVEYNIYYKAYRVKLDNRKDIYDFKPEELELIKNK